MRSRKFSPIHLHTIKKSFDESQSSFFMASPSQPEDRRRLASIRTGCGKNGYIGYIDNPKNLRRYNGGSLPTQTKVDPVP